jgi:hypothetical protein
MNQDDADAILVVRLVPRLRLLHEQNGSDWADTIRDALALMRQTHQVDPHDGAGAEPGGAATSAAPREDD